MPKLQRDNIKCLVFWIRFTNLLIMGVYKNDWFCTVKQIKMTSRIKKKFSRNFRAENGVKRLFGQWRILSICNNS
jgi:hypothetical protein